MRSQLGWGLAVAAAAAASWATWTSQPAREPLTPPEPLPRPATSADLQAAQAQADALTTAIAKASDQAGRALEITEFESSSAEGEPFLPNGIPDNPLIGGVGTVASYCPGEALPPTPADWLYCKATASILPGLSTN